jgi:thioredoxin 1
LDDKLIPGIVLGVFFLIVLLLQLIPRLAARHMKGQRAPALDAFLGGRQKGQARLLLYFWSPSCGMCKNMTPVINELMALRDDVVSIDISQHLDLARAFGVMGTPALAIIEQGIVREVSLGVKSRARIVKMLED